MLLTFNQAIHEVLKRSPNARIEFFDCGFICLPEIAKGWQVFKRGEQIQEKAIFALRENCKEVVYLDEDGAEVSVCRARLPTT